MKKYLEHDDRKFYIYKMYDKNDELLYIGKTTNIETRLNSHFTKDMVNKQAWKKDVVYIKYFELYTKVDMDITELYLIALERPKFNMMSTDTELPRNDMDINVKKCHDVIYFSIPQHRIEDLINWGEYKNKIKENLSICQHEKINSIGDSTYACSNMWYERHSETNVLISLKNNTYNYFRHIVNGKSSENMWTCFESYKEKIKGKGYVKGFINSDCKLSKFDNCKNFAYLMNKFPTDLERENEEYADLLSIYDLIRIIKYITVDLNHKLNVYIPSRRVRELLENWLDN